MQQPPSSLNRGLVLGCWMGELETGKPDFDQTTPEFDINLGPV